MIQEGLAEVMLRVLEPVDSWLSSMSHPRLSPLFAQGALWSCYTPSAGVYRVTSRKDG